MRKNEPVKAIMTTDVKTVQLGQPLSEARRLLSELDVHQVPVVDGGRLVGMVTTTDIMRLSFGLGSSDPKQLDAILDHTYALEDAMTAELVRITPGTTVRDAALVFQRGRMHSLPVVDDAGHLQGIVTTTDMIGYLLEQY